MASRRPYVDDFDAAEDSSSDNVTQEKSYPNEKAYPQNEKDVGEDAVRAVSVAEVQNLAEKLGDREDGLAPVDDISYVMDKVDTLSVADCRFYLEKLLKEHEYDYNFENIPPANPSSVFQRTVRLIQRTVLFVPYALLVGLAPMIFPQYLSAVTFSPFFGYFARPRSPFRAFGHHMRMLPYHVGFVCALLASLWLYDAALAAGITALVLSGVCLAWHDFLLYGVGGGQDLGVDDRTSIYWLLKGVYFGRRDMVCSVGDLDRLCACPSPRIGPDADEDCVCQYQVNVMGDDEGDFDKLHDADGPVECTITVTGSNAGENGTQMRIVVQCMD